MSSLTSVLTDIGLGAARLAHLGRRQFLRLGVVSSGVSLLALVISACGGSSGTSGETVTAYRLSTHKRRTCGACKSHGANRFYRTSAAADGDRAHAGCNCRIVTQPISADLAGRYFSGNRDAYDTRWGS